MFVPGYIYTGYIMFVPGYIYTGCIISLGPGYIIIPLGPGCIIPLGPGSIIPLGPCQVGLQGMVGAEAPTEQPLSALFSDNA